MAEHTLSILTPSVNNLSARIFVRAAGLEFEELDVWGKKDEPQFVGGDSPSIADIRWAASLEFLRAIDYDFPGWAEDYMLSLIHI